METGRFGDGTVWRQGTVLCLLSREETKNRPLSPNRPVSEPSRLQTVSVSVLFPLSPSYTFIIGKQRLEFFIERSYNKNGLKNQLYRARFHFRILPGDVNVPA